jgi:hypothetical protein
MKHAEWRTKGRDYVHFILSYVHVIYSVQTRYNRRLADSRMTQISVALYTSRMETTKC